MKFKELTEKEMQHVVGGRGKIAMAGYYVNHVIKKIKKIIHGHK